MRDQCLLDGWQNIQCVTLVDYRLSANKDRRWLPRQRAEWHAKNIATFALGRPAALLRLDGIMEGFVAEEIRKIPSTTEA